MTKRRFGASSRGWCTALGFDTVLASDGREAWSCFAQNPDRFSAVLLDLTMPHMNGEEAFAEMTRLRPNVRVVLMSGYSEQDALARFPDTERAGFLQKPFSVDVLRGALRASRDA